MPTVRSFDVAPKIPERFEVLQHLAYNLFLFWDPESQDLFRVIDHDLWRATHYNPVLFLGSVRQERLEELAHDEAFLAQLERAKDRLKHYMGGKGWFQKAHRDEKSLKVAYFSMEFGLAACLPIYSGGLGVLSGDHLKSASDIGLPLAGVGLLYQQGYFNQYLNADGWQQEVYTDNDFHNLPIALERRPDGLPLTIEVDLPDRKVQAQIWRVQVGKVPLYLLDTNIPANTLEDQDITDQLYGGDRENRIRQEILLGIGGVRALRAVGFEPTVYHMNEGHSAFLALERIRLLMANGGISFAEAMEALHFGNVFTTHTAVPAGIDLFPLELVEKYFADYLKPLGINVNDLMKLGKKPDDLKEDQLNMAQLAMTMSAWCNGVSKLHGKVSRSMWQVSFPDVPEDEIPISSITNGIHGLFWASQEMGSLFDRYLGPGWRTNPKDLATWERVGRIPDEELWRCRERTRQKLVQYSRGRLQAQLRRNNASSAEIDTAGQVLSADALTIGFARRFATYKRATLILRDPERLKRILVDANRPVQLIFAGKAHPQDAEGKDLIRRLIHYANSNGLRNHVVFLEDYELAMARVLVQGVDLWLNTPRRPLEASGTSGMKVCFNGGLNCSILDGWWDEAHYGSNGWAIGQGEEYDLAEYQDEVESNALYHLLEQEIIPSYYSRDRNNIPRQWIGMIKESIRTNCPVFNTNRMVSEYAERFYIPADQRAQEMTSEKCERAKKICAWKKRVSDRWAKVAVQDAEMPVTEGLTVGESAEIRAWVTLGDLRPEDVSVQVYHGRMSADRRVVGGSSIELSFQDTGATRTYLFTGRIICGHSGRHGYAIRVLPKHPDLIHPMEMRLICWE